MTEWPMFGFNEAEQRWDPLHHPFTAPDGEFDPERPGRRRGARLRRRLERPGARRRLDPDLRPGAPAAGARGDRDLAPRRPRSGSASCSRRFATARRRTAGSPTASTASSSGSLHADSIRDVIAFPKAASGADPLTGAPAPVDEAQLRELGLAPRASTRPGESAGLPAIERRRCTAGRADRWYRFRRLELVRQPFICEPTQLPWEPPSGSALVVAPADTHLFIQVRRQSGNGKLGPLSIHGARIALPLPGRPPGGARSSMDTDAIQHYLTDATRRGAPLAGGFDGAAGGAAVRRSGPDLARARRRPRSPESASRPRAAPRRSPPPPPPPSWSTARPCSRRRAIEPGDRSRRRSAGSSPQGATPPSSPPTRCTGRSPPRPARALALADPPAAGRAGPGRAERRRRLARSPPLLRARARGGGGRGDARSSGRIGAPTPRAAAARRSPCSAPAGSPHGLGHPAPDARPRAASSAPESSTRFVDGYAPAGRRTRA